MYHIKNDKRSKKSAKLICDGLADVLKYKDYYQISISDVCCVSGIARTTFYRLFDILDDVLLYQFDTLFEKSISEYNNLKVKDKSYAKLILNMAINNKSLTTILVNSKRIDLFDFSTRLNEDILINSMGIDIDDKSRKYCTPMLNSMIFATIKTWVAGEYKETAEELYEIIKSNIFLMQKYL